MPKSGMMDSSTSSRKRLARKKKQMETKTESFVLTVIPGGGVVERSSRQVASARRVAGLSQLNGGGQIVMSTDVNANVGPGLKNWARGHMKTWYNRLMRSRKIDDAIRERLDKEGMDSGWTIGNLFKGRYFSKESGKQFNEKSFAVEILGVDFSFVKNVAMDLLKSFDQETVLVKDFKTGKIFLMKA